MNKRTKTRDRYGLVFIVLIFSFYAFLMARADKVTDRLKSGNRAYRREVRVDYESCPGKVVYWYSDGTARTNTPKRVDCIVQTNTVELTVAKVKKVEKDAENAEKHDAKNFRNWLEDTVKAHDKSSEAMRPFYDDILFFATNRTKKVLAKVRYTDMTDAATED